MRKEEFFDTLGDVEQKYIGEAFFDDFDDSIGVAKPGKAKITPMKILAPIAAGLAVVLGACVLIPKLKTARERMSPATEVSSDIESVQSEKTSVPTDGITEDDIPECKEMLLAEQGLSESDGRPWQTSLIDIDGDGSTELFVSSGDKDDFPGVYAFAKTENGIEIAGTFDTEDNRCNAQSIMLFNKYGESFWYYYTDKILTFNDGKAISGESSLCKVTAKDGVISAEKYMSSGSDYDTENNEFIHFYTINGVDVSWEEYLDEGRKFGLQWSVDIESISNSDMTLSDFYAPLRVEELPEADRDDVYDNDALTLARATLCSQTFGEYEVSIVGQNLYADRELENSVTVGYMSVVISKNGVLLDYSTACPLGGSIGEYEAHVKADDLDEILDIVELNDGTIIICAKYYSVEDDQPVTFDNPKTAKFHIFDDKLSPL